jgi:uncharacterized protein YwgA
MLRDDKPTRKGITMGESKGKAYSRMDVLLLLLYSEGFTDRTNEPVGGMTRLQKEVFLTQKSLAERRIKCNYPFRPYTYGPFTRDLYRDIELLKSEGVVKEEQRELGEKGIYRVFSLTDKGLDKASNLLQDEIGKEIHAIVRALKNKYNNMSLYDLVEYTHKVYPEYVQDRRELRRTKS